MAEGADNMLDGDRATHAGVTVKQVTIFLSDGNPDPDSYAPNSDEITSYLAASDTAYAVAIGPDGGDLGSGGNGVSYALMRQIAKPGFVSDGNPGAFRFVTSARGLPNLFSEIYEEIACPTGTLEVVKDLSPTNDNGKFDLSIAGSLLKDEAGHGGTTGERTLIAGNYAFAESADGETSLANYTSSASCVNQAAQNLPVAVKQGEGATWSVDLAAGADLLCTITNTRKAGTLTVTKVVTKDNGGTAACNDFGFKVDGGATIGFEADCTNVISLPTGSYSVSEPAVSGYATSYANSQDGDLDCNGLSVPASGNVTCTITNNDRPGTLIVDKDLTTDDGSDATCDDFGFKVNGSSAIDFEADCSNSLTVNAGTYSVVETDAAGFTTGYANCAGLVVPSGGSATCTVSNDDLPGTLIVNKVISGGDAACEDFSFSVNDGRAVDFDGDCSKKMSVDAGTFSVVETKADGYDASYENCSQLWIPNGGTQTCTITNTRETGTVTVVKDLEPNDDPGRFDLQVNGVTKLADAGDGDSTGPITLDTGDHTVGEVGGSSTSMANYASSIECVEQDGEGSSVVASGMGAGPLSIEVKDGDDIVCTISNTRVSVGIAKANDAGESATVEPGDTVHYTLTVTVNNGPASDVVVTDALPDGLTYVDGSADPAAGFSASGQDLTWTVGNLAKGAHTFAYDATVDEDASGELTNLGCVDAAQNHDFPLFDLFDAADQDGGDLPCDQTTVLVQHLSIEKTNSARGDVRPGSTVGFTLTLSVTNGPIDSVTIVDELPAGLGNATAVSDGGIYDAAANTITWTLSDIADGRELTYSAAVSATATDGELTNVATITDGPCVDDGCDDDSTVTVVVPEGGELGGNPTPTPELPDTAMTSPAGTSPAAPMAILLVIFLGSLSTTALVTVKVARGRRS